MERDFERMLFCEVCGADACFGFGVTLDGLRMGDVGSWRCDEHHPDADRQIPRTREEWSASNGTAKINMPTQEAAE